MSKKEEKAKQFADRLHKEVEEYYGRKCDPKDMYFRNGDIILAFEAGWDAALKNQWVKVEDAMPEKCKIVIVLHSDMTVGVSAYHCDNNWSNFEDDIIAWMPIPSFDDILEENNGVLKRLKNK